MNSKTNNGTNQEVKEGTTKKTRAQYRREAKENKGKAKVKIKAVGVPMSNGEIERRQQELLSNLTSKTWRDLETQGKFKKDEKLSFVDDDTLIIGCDVGSEKHYIRAIDTRGRELGKKAYGFSNDKDGFENAKGWAVDIAARHKKTQIIMGIESTGHYWLDLATSRNSFPDLGNRAHKRRNRNAVFKKQKA